MQSWNVRSAHALSSPVFQAQGKAQAGDRPVRPGPALRRSAAGPSGRPCRKAAPWRQMGTHRSQGLAAACSGSLHGHPWQTPPSLWWAQSQLHPAYHPPHSPLHRGRQGKDKGRRQPHLALSPASVYPAVCVSR